MVYVSYMATDTNELAKELPTLKDVMVRDVPFLTLKLFEPDAQRAYERAGGSGTVSWPFIVRWAMNELMARMMDDEIHDEIQPPPR